MGELVEVVVPERKELKRKRRHWRDLSLTELKRFLDKCHAARNNYGGLMKEAGLNVDKRLIRQYNACLLYTSPSPRDS